MTDGDAALLSALGAVLCWAASAPIISRGLKLVGEQPAPRMQMLYGLAIGLTTGVALFILYDGPPSIATLLDLNVFLGGLLTYIFGTGLYYLAAVAYKENAGIAAQFANVKPLLTITAGILLFHEELNTAKVISIAVIGLGCGVIIFDALQKKTSLEAPALGFLLAASWSGGEVFMRRALEHHTSLEATKAALCVSAAAAIAAMAAYRRASTGVIDMSLYAHRHFALHGVLSFALAYMMFFHAISLIGLSSTVLVTVFWPTLALALNSVIHPGSLASVSRLTLVSMAALTAGAVIFVFFGGLQR